MSTVPRVVPSGAWEGCAIRRARIPFRCEYWRGISDDRAASENGRCPNRINIGDYYVEGEFSDKAGGYGHARYCLQCVPAAKAAVDAALVHTRAA